MGSYGLQHSTQSTNLADILERVLDKGIVIAGDISISLVGVELLSIKVRLLIASVDKAAEMGINWWQNDPQLSVRAQSLEQENKLLNERLARLEQRLAPPIDVDAATGS
ncbi:gas vesicle synthesis protein GvpS (GvpA-related) [Oscillochloris trichoides DG-6]|uniref:Gas vesicle synthesis protein GvpS (GvpA-related) n=1 Tax=Oscillochloris trichoides DG-6 TaxID=765420 RepID=E1IGU5_9CHLR|nr:gas vesicle protein [Oscillochloris trichoides]EFO79420.1 gas vesicle synthesis protein GvpS (GvpA-related) [Oscillochloris trichoides DG-6]